MKRITNLILLILLRGVLKECTRVMKSPVEMKIYEDRLTGDELDGVLDMDRLNRQLLLPPKILLKDLRHLKKVLARPK